MKKIILFILCLFVFSCDNGGTSTICEKIIGGWQLLDIETIFPAECSENLCDNDCQEQIREQAINDAAVTGFDQIILDGENITSSNNPEYDFLYTCEDNTLEICSSENMCADWLLTADGETLILSKSISLTTEDYPDGTGCLFDYRMIYERNNTENTGGENNDSIPSLEENCSDIPDGSEWDAITLDINILDDMGECSNEDSSSDASNINWAFQSGIVEQNDSNPGVWTVEKYYECTTDNTLKICSDQEMTNNCIIYGVEVSSNSLSLTTMIIEGNECDKEETLHFIPED